MTNKPLYVVVQISSRNTRAGWKRTYKVVTEPLTKAEAKATATVFNSAQGHSCVFTIRKVKEGRK
jgi:hypothetical protein